MHFLLGISQSSFQTASARLRGYRTLAEVQKIGAFISSILFLSVPLESQTHGNPRTLCWTMLDLPRFSHESAEILASFPSDLDLCLQKHILRKTIQRILVQLCPTSEYLNHAACMTMLQPEDL